ncbi:MAG: type IV secretion system DNA-binding domain-containing protein [Patescibacteria group bacterium]|nr:type IV secretion system DNA-binding domain-containing protein [Patescibacteria group bacterium]
MSILLSFIIIVLLIVGAVWFYFYWRTTRRKKLMSQLQMPLFLIRLPRISKEGKDLKKEIETSEQLFATLASFGEPFVFEVAVPHVGQEISFYASVKEKYADIFVRQLQSFWSEASLERVDDYNVFNYAGFSAGAFVVEKERFILPLKTYEEVDADTFLPILGSLSKINEIGEGGAFQLVARPTNKKHKKEISSAIKVLRSGWQIGELLKNDIWSISAADVMKAAQGTAEKKTGDEVKRSIDEESLKMVSAKAGKVMFDVNVRVVASAPNQMEAESLLRSLTAGFSQFGAPNRNELSVVKPANQKQVFHDFSFREFNESEAMVLGSNELASIFHLPTPMTDVPRIKYLKAREAAPPPNLPKDGVMIGFSRFRGETKEVRITDDDRRRHMYIIGQTGTGKSNFLSNMIVGDIRRGKGVGVIDPHGDLVDDILSVIPKEREDDVILFDPGNLKMPVGLNMLEYDFSKPEEKTSIVNEMLQIFDKLYDLKTTGGPMFEQYMRNALLLLMEDAPNEPSTLMEVARVFSDAEFRRRKLERISNPVVRDFWEKEAVKAGGEAALQNITPYVTSKFNNFTSNDYMRPIVGQVKSAFNFREIMDSGKILLVNLSKGKVGDLNANLLGMIFVGKILMASLGRADVSESKRKDFYLFIDEFQNFTTDSVSTILSEARKYKLNLTVAHQFIAQLSEKTRDAVFGNVGSTISFRIGPHDAEFLVKTFEPVFSVNDLVNIDNYQAYARILINGETSRPFNIIVPKAERGSEDQAETLKEKSYVRYGEPREAVESEIYRRLRA